MRTWLLRTRTLDFCIEPYPALRDSKKTYRAAFWSWAFKSRHVYPLTGIWNTKLGPWALSWSGFWRYVFWERAVDKGTVSVTNPWFWYCSIAFWEFFYFLKALSFGIKQSSALRGLAKTCDTAFWSLELKHVFSDEI